MATRDQSKIQEDLVSLYLRLNGFFVSPFLVHSSVHGRNKTELDALALRLPFNSEPERQIGPDPLLDLSSNFIELLLCEVKSNGQQLRFNEALTEDPGAIATAIRWSGLFDESETTYVSNELALAFKKTPGELDRPVTVEGPRGTRVRAMIFSPERSTRRTNQLWFVHGQQLMNYIWKCLAPLVPRSSCATTYDLQLWGRHEPIVRYFKQVGSNGPGTIKALYEFTGVS